MGVVKMNKSKSNLRKEDEIIRPKISPVQVNKVTSPVFVPGKSANFIENINNGLAIGGSNGNLNTQIPQSTDSTGGRQLSQSDLEKILKEI